MRATTHRNVGAYSNRTGRRGQCPGVLDLLLLARRGGTHTGLSTYHATRVLDLLLLARRVGGP
jgi:hypothetical protein